MSGANGQSIFDFDKNEDGVVNGMELYSVLTYLDGRLGYTPKEARVILQLADTDGDNQLDISDLLQLSMLVETESLQHK
ncbi:probable calcium-binding protein CML28 [Haliotis rufescens]|nr:probable calcium-binding protein CML28 [Haliotis rufescens]